MDDKREVSEETRNGGAKAPFKFFHSSHQIVGSNPSDITAPTDKAVADFVNSSIATNSGRFQGTYETVGDLPLSGVRDNDYAFVVTVKPDGNPEYDRYKFSAQAGWMFEYRLNNSGFTAAQWAAITSGLSAADKARLDAMEDGAQENRIETVKVNGTAVEPVDKAVDIAVPTKTSDIENDSDFATNAGTVHKTGDETVMGVKTFGDSPVVPNVSMTSDSSGKAASTKWVGSKIAAWWDNLRKTAAVEFAQSVKAVGGFIGNLTGDVTGHASEDVPQTRKVAGHALTMDVELSASDVGALPDTTVIPPAAKGSTYVDVATDGVVSVLTDSPNYYDPSNNKKAVLTSDSVQCIFGNKTFSNCSVTFKDSEIGIYSQAISSSNLAKLTASRISGEAVIKFACDLYKFIVDAAADGFRVANHPTAGTSETADYKKKAVATCGWVNDRYLVTEIVQGSNIVLTPDSANPKKFTIAAVAAEQVQSDWNQTDTTKKDFIKNKPTIPTIPNLTKTDSGSGSVVTGLSVSGHAITVSKGNIAAATTSAAGLMSAADKSKLDGIAAGANAYTHPSHTAHTSGLYKVTVDNQGHVTAATEISLATVATSGSYSDLTNKPDHVPYVADSSNEKTAVTIGSRKSGSTVGFGSTACGDRVTASGIYSHAEGQLSTASGSWSHAEGYQTTASGQFSHAEGSNSTASGNHAHAGGTYTQAKGANSHAIGARATANNTGTFVWNGQTDSSVIPGEYADHGAGTFNVNPSGGAAGFYIGSKKLSELIPTMPTVNNGTLTIKTGDTTKGTFTANQADGTTVSLAKVAGTGAYGDLTGLPSLFSGFVRDIGFKEYRDLATNTYHSIVANASNFPVSYAEEYDSWYPILRVYNQSTSSNKVTIGNFVSTTDTIECTLDAHESKFFFLADYSLVANLGISACTVRAASAKINIDAFFILV